jgi:putative ABC transport system permease protein
MLRLLRTVSVAHFRNNRGRTVLVIGGIATGLALIVAISIINASVLDNFRRTIAAIAGPADLEVRLGTGEIGFPDIYVQAVETSAGVEDALPLVRGTLALADAPDDTLQLFGADFVSEDALPRYQIVLETDRRVLQQHLADPRSILLTSRFARERRLTLGDTLAVAAPKGVVEVTIRGLMAPEGFARAFAGELAVMDLPAAQLLLGKEGRGGHVNRCVNEIRRRASW